MATVNGRKRGRKPASKKAPAKRKRVSGVGKSSSSPAKRTFGGKEYSFLSCFGSKTAASKAACQLRADGKRARVVDGCVYSRSAK